MGGGERKQEILLLIHHQSICYISLSPFFFLPPPPSSHPQPSTLFLALLLHSVIILSLSLFLFPVLPLSLSFLKVDIYSLSLSYLPNGIKPQFHTITKGNDLQHPSRKRPSPSRPRTTCSSRKQREFNVSTITAVTNE